MKVYLDTSVISHLEDRNMPERTKDTWLFWDELKARGYEVFISDVVLQELELCPQPKQTYLFNHLGDIEHEVLHVNDEVRALTMAYIKNGILTQKHINDCAHIAFASVYCDVIVSWNFRHILRLSTIQRVRAVNMQNGYNPIDLVQPTMI